MKKVYISVPMRGRSKKAINNTIKQMHRMAEIIFGEKLEVIHTKVVDDIPDNTNERIFRLGESIKLMAVADYFIGVNDVYDMFPGCSVEKTVAAYYHIPSYCIPLCEFRTHCFLKDIMEPCDKSEEESC